MNEVYFDAVVSSLLDGLVAGSVAERRTGLRLAFN